MRYSLPILLISGLLFSYTSRATTISPFANLLELYLASDAVALVQSGATYETPTTNCTHYDCDFTVLVPLKGSLGVNQVFPLRQYSHYDDTGRLGVSGDFVPQEGHAYLVFLDQRPDGWRLMMLSYYVFEDIFSNNDHYLVPIQESRFLNIAPRPDGTVVEQLATYRRDALLQMLQQQAKATSTPWDGRPAQATLAIADQMSDRVLPTGCDFDLGTGTSRWQSTNINLYYDVTNAPADVVGRVTNVVATLNTQYGLNLVAAGSTDFSPICTDGSVVGQDFINFNSTNLNGAQSILLFFGDPCSELTNLNGCNGVYGIGGGYNLNTTHVFKGDTWFNATWGYAVINNGARECLDATRYEELLEHELTHALRMDHVSAASYSNNNMNPTCCNPIGDKDRECMNYVYGAALPVELISFNAKAIGDEVLLTWTTAQEINNDYFIVERSGDGRKFERLATVEASNVLHSRTYTLTDEQPAAGVNYYRLSQADRDGKTKELAIRAVTYRGEVSGYTLVPNPASGTSIILTSRAKEPGAGSLQIFSATGKMVYETTDSQKLAGNRLEVPISDLPAGIYWLKINESGRSETLKFVRQ